MGNMPTNYTNVFYDNFSGGSVNRGSWPISYGGGSSNGAYSYNSGNVHTGNGLNIDITRNGGSWSTGGIGQGWNGGTYGLYQVQAKIDPGKGTGPNINLWPNDGQWPGPEIDLVEAPNGVGHAFMSLHWRGGDGSNQYVTIDSGADVNQWHNYAVDWEPNALTFYVDGNSVWSTSEHIPTKPLGLNLSGFVATANDGWYHGGPNSGTPSTVGVHVAWVSISKPGGNGGGHPSANSESNGGGGAPVASGDVSGVGDGNSWSGQILSARPGVDVLNGGHGGDTFYVDVAHGDGWAEINGWGDGDFVDFIGAQGGRSTISWANATDRNGHWGATASISVNGDGHVDSMVTFTGVDAGALSGKWLAAWTHDGAPNLGLYA